MSVALGVLEKALGHTFRDRELLERALTHSSRAYEKLAENGLGADNEQLEFLGDAILGFAVSASLVRRFPSLQEGSLSKLKAQLVSAAHLYAVAQELQLGAHLRLGRGEERSGGREKKALLSDAVEALIAALYLDAGLDAACRFIEDCIIGSTDLPADGVNSTVPDHKSALQKLAQDLDLPLPRYSVVAEDGPEHSKTFTVEVRVGKDWVSQAQGLSKKSASQKAAQQILQQLLELGR